MRASFLGVEVTHKLSGELADMVWGSKVEEKFIWDVLEVMGCELQGKKEFPKRQRRIKGIL